ncbi:MAG: glycosyltransferase family 25 protein [Nitrosomonas sp.]|nr:glycosyltransferase family 25 protein [Nitrosomonas sp.]
MRNIYIRIKKYIQRHRHAPTGPWQWFFGAKDTAQSFLSRAFFAMDRLLLIFKKDEVKLLHRETDAIEFEVMCINLLRRPDKKRFMEKQFDGTGLKVHIFPAVDGLAIDVPKLINDGVLAEDNFCPATGMALIPAQIGAYLSHYELWKTALSLPNEISLILEDDALLVCDIPQLEVYARHIPADTDIFFLNRRKNKTRPVSLYASTFTSRFWGLTAYFITRKGAEKLVRLMLPIHKSADEAINELNKLGMITCYCARKELVVECSNSRDERNFRFESDIITRTKE